MKSLTATPSFSKSSFLNFSRENEKVGVFNSSGWESVFEKPSFRARLPTQYVAGRFTNVSLAQTCTDPATDIYQGACSRVSRAYIARRMLLPQDLLLRRRVSPCGFFQGTKVAVRLHESTSI